MYKSNKVLEGSNVTGQTFTYQVGAGHLNGLFITTDKPAELTLQVMLKGQRSEVLINNITLDKLQGISDFMYGCGSAHAAGRMVVEGLDNEAAVEGAYPEYFAEAAPKIGIMIPLGSLHFKNGTELHVTVIAGTAVTFNLSEVSYESTPEHYLQITQYLTSNETFNNALMVFAHRDTYNHVADVQVTTSRFGASINSLEQMNAISAAIGRAEAYRNYKSTCIWQSDFKLPQSVAVRYTGTNSASIITLVVAKFINPAVYVQTMVENQNVINSNPVNTGIAVIAKRKVKPVIKPGIGSTGWNLSKTLPAFTN